MLEINLYAPNHKNNRFEMSLQDAATLVSPLPPSLSLEKSRNRLATFYPHPQLRKLRPAAVRFAQGFENRIHAAFFDFADMRHELTESAFGEGALFEPEQIFLG
jgi:hypothetical protein